MEFLKIFNLFAYEKNFLTSVAKTPFQIVDVPFPFSFPSFVQKKLSQRFTSSLHMIFGSRPYLGLHSINPLVHLLPVVRAT